MTEEKTTSHLTKLLEWLPEQFHDWVRSSGTLLSLILSEVMEDRDVRVTGGINAAQTECSLIAVLQKVLSQEKSKRFLTVVLCASREAEELTLSQIREFAANTELTIRATTGLRNKSAVAEEFEEPADIIISSLHGMEKLLDTGRVQLEQIRTLVLDDIDWLSATGDLKQISRFCESLPAARQIIGVAQSSFDDPQDLLTDILHAPAVCRAPDMDETSREIKERLIVVPEDKLEEFLAELPGDVPTLFISDSPTESSRLVSAMKSRDVVLKRATATQSESARETLLLKFVGGLVKQLVTPNVFLKNFSKNSLKRIVHTDIPGGAKIYMTRLDLLEQNGELITVTVPKKLSLMDELLKSSEKKLAVENPFGIEDLLEEVGLIVRREKLTIRSNFDKQPDADGIPDEAPAAEIASEESEGEPYYRKKRHFKRKYPRQYDKKRKFYKKDRNENAEGDIPADVVSSSEEGFEGIENPKHVKKGNRYPYNKKKRFGKRPHKDVQPDFDGTLPNDEEKNDNGYHHRKPRFNKYGKKPRKNAEMPAVENDSADFAQPALSAESEQNAAPKKFNKFSGHKKRPFNKKPRKHYEAPREEWDEDNFGNSIHYQPRRQNLRTLRSDQPIHWQPDDPFLPSSQALSLPQMMPDENSFRHNPSKQHRKGGFNRSRRPNFKKYRGSSDN